MGVWKIRYPNIFQADEYTETIVVKPKDPVSKENMVGTLYKINFEEYDAMNVGETERFLK